MGCWGSLGGVGVHWGSKWTGTPTTLGSSSGSQHSHWFPLGSDLPHQGQARAPVEDPITPTGFPWRVTYLAKAKQVTEMSYAGYYIHLELYFDSLHICIYATSSHILTCNAKKCYADYFLCRPIYAFPYTINLMYYDTMVLITNNYLSHQTSELGTSYFKCQADLM